MFLVFNLAFCPWLGRPKVFFTLLSQVFSVVQELHDRAVRANPFAPFNNHAVILVLGGSPIHPILLVIVPVKLRGILHFRHHIVLERIVTTQLTECFARVLLNVPVLVIGHPVQHHRHVVVWVAENGLIPNHLSKTINNGFLWRETKQAVVHLTSVDCYLAGYVTPIGPIDSLVDLRRVRL